MTKKQRSVYNKKYRKTHKAELKAYYQRLRKEHPEKLAASLRSSGQKRKREAVNHYGKVCKCCSEDRLVFLCIDHIDGGGNKHRRKIGTGVVLWLRKNKYPKGFQVLCHNCNFAKSQGVCPHKETAMQ